jgi:hypothetical protein
MSFLGNILKVAGNVIPAIFTGGASLPFTGAITDALGGAGEAVGKATSASGQNRLDQEKLALQAHNQNILGGSEFERQLLARAKAEDDQRLQARRDAYRASVAANPNFSPYNPRPQVFSPQFLSDMGNVGTAASSRLSAPPINTVSKMAPVTPYTPLDIKNLQASTGTQKGTLEKIGDWAGPISSILGRFLRNRSSAEPGSYDFSNEGG